MSRNTLIVFAIFSFSVAGTAAASPSRERPAATVKARSDVQMDVEVDPIAYALTGYSLHAGFRWNRFRLDLGAFALEIPASLHGTEGVDVYGDGFGAKLDYYPSDRLPGLFLGMQLSRVRESVTHRATTQAKTAHHTTVGARIGYRFDVKAGFYVLPWIGVDVSTTSRTQTVAGTKYEPGRAMFFPTIHLGKRF